MASTIHNIGYPLAKSSTPNSFVYGYNGTNGRMDSPIQNQSLGSYGAFGSPPFNAENLAELFEKMLGFRYLPTKLPTEPKNAFANENVKVWCGELPPRNYCNPIFSSKIFIGGIPWDISEKALMDAFLPYGFCKVEWPSGNFRGGGANTTTRNISRSIASGYVYIVFETEHSVLALLKDCNQTYGSAGELYFRLSTRRHRTTEYRQVQVIPWVISDAMYIPPSLNTFVRSYFLELSNTVYIGALHGMMTASVLADIMQNSFGPIVYVGINTDKNRYPIGSGRVTFASKESYDRAVECEFLEVRTSKFNKRIQIDPFLEDSKCAICNDVAPYFCRSKDCFKYYCQRCWSVQHPSEGPKSNHRVLIYNTRRMSSNSNDDNESIFGVNVGQLFRGESHESA